jgi:hypothetical protein
MVNKPFLTLPVEAACAWVTSGSGQATGRRGLRSRLRDNRGGVWQREILVQGNAVFTHSANENRIAVPLR